MLSRRSAARRKPDAGGRHENCKLRGQFALGWSAITGSLLACCNAFSGKRTFRDPCTASKFVIAIPGGMTEVERLKTSSTSRLWVNVSTIVYEEPRRNRMLIVHLARDISHRKKKEELLAKMLDLSRALAASSEHANGLAPVSSLSEQEQRILGLFAKAKNSIEIARELGITLPTRTASTRNYGRTTVLTP